MNIIKYIIKNLPKTIRWIIVSIIITPILGYIIIQIAAEKHIEFSTEIIIYVIMLVFLSLIAGYSIGAYRAVSKLLSSKPSIKAENKSTKPKVPHKEITIGTYRKIFLSSDIRAEILITEKIKPSVDDFLDRIREGDPFCSQCSRPLDILNANYLANFAQIGYKCTNCETQIKGNWEDLRKGIKGEVRKNYDSYWQEYKKQIQEFTNGKSEEFELPEY
jgi:uncharacterized protein YneF (UPF0154 family)